MTVAGLLIAVLALAVAYVALRRMGALESRLAETGNRLSELGAQLTAHQAEAHEELVELRLHMRQQAGELSFSPTMTIAEAMDVHPKVVEVLASFHLGGCSHCAVSDVDTIEGACQTYGIDQKALMMALNRLIDPLSGGSTGPIKVANMKLEI
jgi:hybrid cluster-associated redox disulfide protein